MSILILAEFHRNLKAWLLAWLSNTLQLHVCIVSYWIFVQFKNIFHIHYNFICAYISIEFLLKDNIYISTTTLSNLKKKNFPFTVVWFFFRSVSTKHFPDNNHSTSHGQKHTQFDSRHSYALADSTSEKKKDLSKNL